MSEPVTKVLFRKWPAKHGGDVIAVFPEHDAGRGCVSSYEHVGQHGSADRTVIWATKPATEAEYAALKRELESAPYHYVLKVIKRWPSRR